MAISSPRDGDIVVDSTGTQFMHNGGTWSIISDSHSGTTTTIDFDSVTLSGSAFGGATDTSPGTWFVDPSSIMGSDFLHDVDIDQFPTEQDEVNEVIDEAMQKEIDKIGTPGKRSIDDLLAAFKVNKGQGKISTIEQLEDESWAEKTWSDAKGT